VSHTVVTATSESAVAQAATSKGNG